MNSSKENIFIIIDLYYSLNNNNNNNIPLIITGFVFLLPKNLHFSDWLISGLPSFVKEGKMISFKEISFSLGQINGLLEGCSRQLP